MSGFMMRRWLEWGVVVVMSWLIQQRQCQLFRFCHRGVFHQLLEKDCPYGLLFNEQLQMPCFYALSGTQDGVPASGNVPRIWPTMCQRPYDFMPNQTTVKDETIGDGFFIAKRNGQIRMIQFVKPGNDTGDPSQVTDLVSFQSCEDRCYRGAYDESISSSGAFAGGAVSHETSDSLESPSHFPHAKLSPEAESVIADQTLRLGDYLFEQLATPDENPGPKLRITELFKRSVKILSKYCKHPFINSNFVNRFLYGFLFLVTDSGIGEIEDISVEEFEEIMVALNSCNENTPHFRLEGVVCDNNAIVKEVVKVLSNGTEFSAPFLMSVPKKETSGSPNDYDPGDETRNIARKGGFPYEQLDVFTEAAWSAVQVTHATCFATFKPNVNMHHKYVTAMEQLFSGKIQDRWRNPTMLTDPRMWGTWFLADVDLAFVNLQACIRGAYLDAPFAMRLDRPIDPARASSSSSGSSSQTSMSEQQSLPNKREKRSAQSDLDSYWDEYHASGGIRHKMTNSIQCFQNPDDRAAAVQLVKDQCTVNDPLSSL